MLKQTEKKKRTESNEINPAEKYFNDGLTELEKFLEKGKVGKLNKAIHIDGWSTHSKFFFYAAIINAILFVLTIFILPYIFVWFYLFFVIFMFGFLFARPEQSYNFWIVIVIFMAIAFIPTEFCQLLLATDPDDAFESSHSYSDTLGQLRKNPFTDMISYIKNFMHVMNWIFFLGCLGYGGAGLVDALRYDFGNAAKKAATIALAIAIYTLISTIFDAMDVDFVDVWDTVGSAWNDMVNGLDALLKRTGIGGSDETHKEEKDDGTTEITIPEQDWLIQLGQPSKYVPFGQIVNTGFLFVPFLSIIFLFALSLIYRHKNVKSILFAKSITEEEGIRVQESKFSIPTAVLLGAMALYTVAYFLITAEPEIVISPFITFIFYLFSVVILFLIALDFLILSQMRKGFKEGAKTILKFTVFGLMVLYAWFQVFQPVMYALGFTDRSNSMYVMAQGSTVFEHDFLQQLFLIAMPETLIFQVFPIGLGNRIYYAARRGKIRKERFKELNDEKLRLRAILLEIEVDPNSLSQENLRKVLKATVLERKIARINDKVERMSYDYVPKSYFILPTILWSIIGSFFFSYYHSFRRGLGFIEWWQNPFYGLTYFGAGMFLCVVSLFSWISAILIHALNNYFAILMTS